MNAMQLLDGLAWAEHERNAAHSGSSLQALPAGCPLVGKEPCCPFSLAAAKHATAFPSHCPPMQRARLFAQYGVQLADMAHPLGSHLWHDLSQVSM